MIRRQDLVTGPIGRRQAALAFGDALRAARGISGISQVTLAISSDLDPSYVGILERGRRVPSFIIIVRLADALGQSPVRLFADGVARLPGRALRQSRALYRLAFCGPDGMLVEVDGAFENLATATHSAEVLNSARKRTGQPELTHLVEYVEAGGFELNGLYG